MSTCQERTLSSVKFQNVVLKHFNGKLMTMKCKAIWALNKLQFSIPINAVIDIIGGCTDTTASLFDYLCCRSLFEYPNCFVCLTFTTSFPFPISPYESHKKDTAIALKIQSGRRAAKTLAGTIYHATAWFTVRVTYTQRCPSTHAGWNMMRVLQKEKNHPIPNASLTL